VAANRKPMLPKTAITEREKWSVMVVRRLHLNIIGLEHAGDPSGKRKSFESHRENQKTSIER